MAPAIGPIGRFEPHTVSRTHLWVDWVPADVPHSAVYHREGAPPHGGHVHSTTMGAPPAAPNRPCTMQPPLQHVLLVCLFTVPVPATVTTLSRSRLAFGLSSLRARQARIYSDLLECLRSPPVGSGLAIGSFG